jgi:aminopeptidase N
VKVKVVYPPEYEASAQPALKATTDSLTYFSDTLGAYPYRTVTAVIPPFNADEAGGMEYPTFFTAEGYDKVEPGTGNVFELDFVTIHEFGHGYFYGLLATNEFEEPMLDEGLNEYWDQRMLRARKQLFIIGNPLMKWWGITNQVSGFDVERITAGLSSPPDPLGQNAWDRFSSGSYGTVYSRTATAMHDLEERLGHDAMEKAFKAYYARWHFRHPSAADLRQSLIESTGEADTVNTIFNQYVYGTGFIDDRVVRINSSEVLPSVGLTLKDGKRTEVTEEENDKRIADARKAWKDSHPDAKDDEGPYPWHSTVTVARDGNPAPQVLEVTFADGVKQRVAWNDERRWARFEFERPVKVVSAELDPDHKFNLDTNKINDSYTTKTSGAAARRWTSDIGAVLQGIYAMLVTL